MCPYCQRVELLLRAKDLYEKIDVRFIDLATPRPAWFLEKTGGTTSVPVLELEDGSILKESLVLMRYIEDRFAGHLPADPYQRAVANSFIALESDFVPPGYRLIMNTDDSKRAPLTEAYLAQVKRIDAFLRRYSPDNAFLFSSGFGLADAVFAPFLLRFTPLLSHYEAYEIPREGHERFYKFHDAALKAITEGKLKSVSSDDVIKAMYDAAHGFLNGKVPDGRKVSSNAPTTPFSARPLPPKDKWHSSLLTDEQLGLLA